MLDGFKRKVAGVAVGGMLKSLAQSKDTRTTIMGLIAGAVLAIPGLDLTKLIGGDPVQVAKLASGLLVALIGYWATKANREGASTAAGAAAGALYAVQGSVESIVTAVVIAVLGHVTNTGTQTQAQAQTQAQDPVPSPQPSSSSKFCADSQHRPCEDAAHALVSMSGDAGAGSEAGNPGREE